MRIGAY